MKVKYLSIFLFIFFATSGKSQICYTSSTFQSFVKVYMTFKTEKKKKLKPERELFATYNVSQKRYKEIAKAALHNEEQTLKPNEEKLIQEIENQNKQLAQQNDALLEQMCKENDISIGAYNDILRSYKSSITFQRSLKPYFDNYIKSLK